MNINSLISVGVPRAGERTPHYRCLLVARIARRCSSAARARLQNLAISRSHGNSIKSAENTAPGSS